MVCNTAIVIGDTSNKGLIGNMNEEQHMKHDSRHRPLGVHQLVQCGQCLAEGVYLDSL
ncbi:hypothetical protein PAXRUDRAFT_830921 [Paxillus rubicundulus Ve08.2h10]|uniref:Uncharacterized protein n=1 Tax=Paxillus rubicundulus Ve08.2h10 TaxID=930991 RepID=A0A0D0E337_9AGAM|nr:hypothetical protein PAXRUDRAFT_830921 [Paxillus rubicundulus Ve08.2h10]